MCVCMCWAWGGDIHYFTGDSWCVYLVFGKHASTPTHTYLPTSHRHPYSFYVCTYPGRHSSSTPQHSLHHYTLTPQHTLTHANHALNPHRHIHWPTPNKGLLSTVSWGGVSMGRRCWVWGEWAVRNPCVWWRWEGCGHVVVVWGCGGGKGGHASRQASRRVRVSKTTTVHNYTEYSTNTTTSWGEPGQSNKHLYREKSFGRDHLLWKYFTKWFILCACAIKLKAH